MKALLPEPRGAEPPAGDGKLGVVAAAHCQGSTRRRQTTGLPLEDLWLWQRPDHHWEMEIKETCRTNPGRPWSCRANRAHRKVHSAEKDGRRKYTRHYCLNERPLLCTPDLMVHHAKYTSHLPQHNVTRPHHQSPLPSSAH
ncbi:hypothetical protein E2C01_053724 [Portunus trituberculatus]|uniref:Uncharacterized protein n=1 Tax=Portunus trituberculatus TaxID=210409 RepID=A0A5B7GPZ9_PORTR|nr:hypothetical protein [Portunus trituberculatus]